jgi:CarD family transcriptional regulator
MVTKKPQQRLGFKTGEYIVYPAHGVGLITSIEEQEVAGLTLELFVISFEQDKLTLRVPVAKIKSVGMRKLAEEDEVKKALKPSPAVPASSAPCGRAAPRNTKPRSIPAT